MAYRHNLRVFAACACMGLLALSSCSDENPIENKPTVTLSGVSDNETVSGTVTIKVDVQGGDAEKIDLVLDGVVIATAVSVNSLETELNTMDIADNEHTLTGSVTDRSGDQKTKEVKFNVLNTLISIDVPSTPFEGTDARRFVFLSDQTGKTLAVQEYKPGDAVRLKAPSFKGTEFFLTEVREDHNWGRYMRTFSNVKRGRWTINPYIYYQARPWTGVAKTPIFNGIPGVDYTLNSNWGILTARGREDSNEIDPLSAYVSESTSLLYLVRFDRDPVSLLKTPTHYALLPNISIGDNDPIDLSQVDNELTVETQHIPIDGDFTGGIVIYGIGRPGHFEDKYFVDRPTIERNKTFTYRYPGEAFADYFTVSELRFGNRLAYNQTHGLPDVEPLDCSVNLTSMDTKITGTISGEEVDAVVLSLGARSVAWSLFGAKGNQDIVIPEIPEMVAAVVGISKSPGVQNVTALAYDDFTNYEEVRNYIISAPNGPSGLTYGDACDRGCKVVFIPVKLP
jgi:hypothetical protein